MRVETTRRLVMNQTEKTMAEAVLAVAKNYHMANVEAARHVTDILNADEYDVQTAGWYRLADLGYSIMKHEWQPSIQGVAHSAGTFIYMYATFNINEITGKEPK